MPRKAEYTSLRSGVWVLMLAIVAGCAQPTVRPLATHWPAKPPSVPPPENDHTLSRADVLDESVPVPEAIEETLHPDPATSPEGNEEPGYSGYAWDRMRSNFQLPQASHPRLDAQIARFQAESHSLSRTLDRSDPYLAWILDQLEERDLPAELALLPVIESGYQPQAQSPSQAVGLWQLIPSTGSRFGLKQNWWYDGRRDLVDSTQAALEYLRYLHDRFEGDWLLALAAYNAGEGRVGAAIRRNREQGKPVDFWHLDLPAQTLVYVPKILALRDIVADPDQYSVQLPEVDAASQIALVETPGQMDLGLAAELAGIPIEDVQRLNPGFSRRATDPDGPHRLVIPVDVSESFAAHVASLPAERQLIWERHKVARGETLSQIARRYDTSVALLREANGLSGKPLKAGKNLLIPVPSRDLAAFRLSTLQRKQQRTVHRVGQGDTLWGVARRYDLSVAELARLNGLGTNATLRLGQSLRVGAGSAVIAKSDGSPAPLHHEVRRGDTLSHISRRYQVSVAELRKWNNLKTTDHLRPGQTLILHVDLARQAGGG